MSSDVIARIDLRGAPLDRRSLRTRLPRSRETGADARAAVTGLLDDVRTRGRDAVLDATERFDGVRPGTLRVPQSALEAALAGLDATVRAALEESIRRARAVARDQVHPAATTEFNADATVTTRWLPVGRVGLYVPGGLAVYPSTVVMNVVPAQAAGVDSIAIASPPQPNGLPHPTVLATAALLGVAEVWAMGGAQAIGALAYGFDSAAPAGAEASKGAAAAAEAAEGESLEPADLITGPGNAYVAAAKSIVRTDVGIDAVAGPTEIIVLADSSANSDFIAADLISQAEHDPAAAAVLVTDSPELADEVASRLRVRADAEHHAERIRTALGGEQSAIILVDDLDAGIAVTNVYAGEHVELHVADAGQVAERIVNGGSVFVGEYAPVALGDYCSGSNHVLPTMGNAAFASALSVQSFLRTSQVVDYSAAALDTVADHIIALAQAEDLPAHGAAVAARKRS